MLPKFRARLASAFDMTVFTLFLAVLVVLFTLFVKAHEPGWPAISAMFYLFGTITAWDGGRREKVMCIGGFVLYAAGWAVVPWLGPLVGSLTCVAGFLLWFQAAFDSAFGPFMVKTPSARYTSV